MTKLLNLSLLLSALVSSIGVTTPALAQSAAPAQNRIVVTTADLDLASSVGQRTLDRRLANAVLIACGTTSVADLAGSNDIRRCRDETSAAIASDRDRLVRQASKGGDIILAAR